MNPTTHYNRCLYVRDYIVWRGQRVVQRIPNDHARFLPARTRLEEFRRLMSRLLLKPKPRGREGMPAAAAERLREVLHPDHPDNPFQPGQRHRNRALILVLPGPRSPALGGAGRQGGRSKPRRPRADRSRAQAPRRSRGSPEQATSRQDCQPYPAARQETAGRAGGMGASPPRRCPEVPGREARAVCFRRAE